MLIEEANTAAEGKVEIVGPMRYSSRAEPARIKSAEAEKSYKVKPA